MIGTLLASHTGMELELTRDETDVLSEALQIYLSEMHHEIADTDKMEFRNELKRKRELLLSVYQRLTPS